MPLSLEENGVMIALHLIDGEPLFGSRKALKQSKKVGSTSGFRLTWNDKLAQAVPAAHYVGEELFRERENDNETCSLCYRVGKVYLSLV